MAGETDLSTLLTQLTPEIDAQPYGFCSVSQQRFSQLPVRAVKGFYRETEGITIIVDMQDVKIYGLQAEGPFACITCKVHSSLDAVGMTAAMTDALTRADISANIIAGFYHDHIYVPWDKAQRAHQVLLELTCK